jgi:hypothetical protein
VFFLAAYSAWLLIFALNRFMVTLELIAPIICATCVASLVTRASIIWSVCVALAIVFPGSALVAPPLMWRPWDNRFENTGGYFGVSYDAPADLLHGGALVVLVGNTPIAFLIPFFPRSTDPSDAKLRRRIFGNAMGQAICRRLTAQQGPLYALRSTGNEPPFDAAALAYYGLTLDKIHCRPVLSKAVGMGVELCPTTRVSHPECEAQQND